MDEFQLAAEMFFGPVYDRDPVSWLEDKLGYFVWSKQKEILESIQRNRYTAVRSCHDAGKSFIASGAACWWNSVHPVGESFVVSTAPSGPQVSAILWREIERMHRKGKLQGRITMGGQPEWKMEKELIGYGRKPSDYDEEGFQGIHALFPLIVVDEACGIPQQLWNAIDALATNDNARVLAIGNPDDATSHFETICRPGSGWNVIHLDGLRTPNFTESEVAKRPRLYQYFVDNEIPFSEEEIPDDLRPRLLGVQWVSERMDRWGVNRTVDEETGKARWDASPLWDAKVRGQFPSDGTVGVIPPLWVEMANQRWITQQGTDPLGPRSFHVDVARFGDDETAVATKQGHVILSVETWGQQDTMTTTNRVAARMLPHPRSFCSVDVIGVGAGVVDRLRELRLNVQAFNASKRTTRKDISGEWSFPNTRSAAWWKLRELLDPSNNPVIAIPPDEDLMAELCAPRWRVAPGAKIIVEQKDEIRKRLGRSTDKADTIVQAYWSNIDTTETLIDPDDLSVEWGGKSDFAVKWD
jgi:hypothetical protein